jgi:hypothetical protein
MTHLSSYKYPVRGNYNIEKVEGQFYELTEILPVTPNGIHREPRQTYIPVKDFREVEGLSYIVEGVNMPVRKMSFTGGRRKTKKARKNSRR